MENVTLAAENQRLRRQVDRLTRTNTILVDSIAQLCSIGCDLSWASSSTGYSQRLRELELDSALAAATRYRASSISSALEVSRKRKDARASAIQTPLAMLSPKKKAKKKTPKSQKYVESEDSDLATDDSQSQKKKKQPEKVTPGEEKKKKQTPQQCLACGLSDAERNIGRHFKQVHSKSFPGTHWVLTPVPLASSRPSVDTVKDWTGIKWDWIGLPKLDYNEDDDSGAGNKTPETVKLGAERIPRDAAMEQLHRGSRKDVKPPQ